MTNLDTLLEGTYRQLQHNMEALDQALLEVKRSDANLSCITNLLVFLIQLSTGMVGDDMAKFQSALTPIGNLYKATFLSNFMIFDQSRI